MMRRPGAGKNKRMKGDLMRRWRRYGLLLALCLPGLAGAAAEGAVVKAVSGSWQDVRGRVVEAIENRGLVVAHVNKIGDMLDRTGKDIGDARPIYSHAEALEFCSAKLSRQMMEADPRNITFCPYAIDVYSLVRQPGTVYIAYRPPAGGQSAASRQALAAVRQMLGGIVRDAMQSP
jgi:uncharacterized protein (DUF302 family)